MGVTELMRGDVRTLQALMLQYPQAELPTTHLFADGMYARILPRPAGTLIVGKVHKHEHFYIVTKGSVQVGEQIYRAGDVIVSQPGTKRAVLALEDSICMTVHRTDKTDLAEIEAELVEPDEACTYGPGNVLLSMKHEVIEQQQEKVK
jgi:hypothetical protein